MHRLRLQTHLRATMQFIPLPEAKTTEDFSEEQGTGQSHVGRVSHVGHSHVGHQHPWSLLLSSGTLVCSPPPSQVSTASENL